MTTTIEKLARAVKDARMVPGCTVARLSDVDRRVARAVLTALLEPSKSMLAKGMDAANDALDSDWDSGPDGESYNSYSSLRSDAPYEIWQKMVQAALDEVTE